MNDGSDSADLAAFYDQWADDYDAAHADWPAWVREQGVLLTAALSDRGVHWPATVLDCTCGIGTQAIGLALAGYTVSGTDVSPGEIRRANAEAVRFGIDVRFDVADLLDPSPCPTNVRFDAVVSANSLTHFADRRTLEQAIGRMAELARPGAIVVITNRDYDAIAGDRPTSTTPQVSTASDVRRISFQLWEWDADGTGYRMEDILMTSPIGSPAANWVVRSRVTQLRAWRRSEIESAATSAGLSDFRWTHHGTQPILTAVSRPQRS